MSKFESEPNMNNSKVNPVEMGSDVNTGKNIESELKTEELEKLNTEGILKQRLKQPELSKEEKLKKLEGEMEVRQQEIEGLSESIEATKAEVNETRKKLGLPLGGDEFPSTFYKEDKLEKLKAEQEKLEIQKNKLISQQEKEQLIRKEKENILQEKIDKLFREFEGLNPHDFESIIKSGKTSEERNIESKSMGFLDPEEAQLLAKAFKKGIKLLPHILETLPWLMKKYDEDLTREAIERIDNKLEKEKQKIEDAGNEEEKKEELKLKEDELKNQEN